MQTLEATRWLHDLDRDLLRERIKSLYAFRVTGETERVCDLLSEDVVFLPRVTWGRAQVATRIAGKIAMREALRRRHIDFEVLLNTLHRVIVDADEACVHRTTTLRERGGGETITFDCVDFFRFRDGLIAEISECPDVKAYEAEVVFSR